VAFLLLVPASLEKLYFEEKQRPYQQASPVGTRLCSFADGYSAVRKEGSKIAAERWCRAGTYIRQGPPACGSSREDRPADAPTVSCIELELELGGWGPRFRKGILAQCTTKQTNKQTPWPLVRKRTISSERPPLVDEI
jgi:hypothetical protein